MHILPVQGTIISMEHSSHPDEGASDWQFTFLAIMLFKTHNKHVVLGFMKLWKKGFGKSAKKNN